MISIFAREITDDLASLVKQVDKVVEKNQDQKAAAFFVLLSDDAGSAQLKLKQLAEKHNINNVPLTVYGNTDGPPSYKISNKADVTVMMWRSLGVKANHAFAKKELDESAIKKVVADSSKILN